MFNIDILGPCKETELAKTTQGYGRASFENKAITHHRLAWCLSRNIHPNEIAGFVVRHLCDNPPCVNVDHLEIGTYVDNMQDKIMRGRCAVNKGESNPAAKLTDQQVLDIRARSRERQLDVAAEYGITRTLVSLIQSRKRWPHL